MSEGSSTTTIKFILGTDIDRATNDVRNAVASVQGNLPASAESPVVARVDDTGRRILTFVRAERPGDGSRCLELARRQRCRQGAAGGATASPRSSAPAAWTGSSASNWTPTGWWRSASGRTRSAARWPRSTSTSPAGGTRIGGGSSRCGRRSAVTVAALADTRVRLAGGAAASGWPTWVRVKDGWEEPRQRARLDGKEVVAFSVYRSVGSSEIDVTKAVAGGGRQAGCRPRRRAFREVTSSSDFVAESYSAAVEALWIGALLAVGVVWLFLRDSRATLISAVALPLSLIPTFAVMRLLDLSLNNITLLALTLVVGILVDDAIVEIENIVRHMRQSGKSA